LPPALSTLLAVLPRRGLWVGYHRARSQWHLEGDIAQPYLFWLEVVHYGLAAAREGPDDWGVWGGARYATLLIHLPPDWQGQAVLDLEGKDFSARHLNRQLLGPHLRSITLERPEENLEALPN
jgi:hypothetical protein